MSAIFPHEIPFVISNWQVNETLHYDRSDYIGRITGEQFVRERAVTLRLALMITEERMDAWMAERWQNVRPGSTLGPFDMLQATRYFEQRYCARQAQIERDIRMRTLVVALEINAEDVDIIRAPNGNILDVVPRGASVANPTPHVRPVQPHTMPPRPPAKPDEQVPVQPVAKPKRRLIV